MIVEGIDKNEENGSGGEIEVERIPTRMIEARSTGLVPVFDYLPTPKIQPTRCIKFESIYRTHFLDATVAYIRSIMFEICGYLILYDIILEKCIS